jgi:hypothetical protein
MKTRSLFFFVVIAMIFIALPTSGAEAVTPKADPALTGRGLDLTNPDQSQRTPLLKRVEGQYFYSCFIHNPSLKSLPQRLRRALELRLNQFIELDEHRTELESRLARYKKATGVEIDLFVCEAEYANYDPYVENLRGAVYKALGPLDGEKRVILFLVFDAQKDDSHRGDRPDYWLDVDVVKTSPSPLEIRANSIKEWGKLNAEEGGKKILAEISVALDLWEKGIIPPQPESASSQTTTP